ncbi:hypothetical protein [Streptomyces sp. NBC_01320]|uniref:hypothetical protein n=1 Tax=Streptomyces sp. NBC_01320 TaxID=2903824 RepID=UPI002E0FC1D9|nr:hypothetical protein OG395_43180 [Streptomyces sp. NBC_01320]
MDGHFAYLAVLVPVAAAVAVVAAAVVAVADEPAIDAVDDAAEDPRSWTILGSGHHDDWCEFKGTLTEYLAGLVTGAVPPDGLPPDFPGATPAIEAD